MKRNFCIRFYLLVLFSFVHLLSYAQSDAKTVTLVSSGSGKSENEAKQIALRNAIEQSFGAFISSKTEILNDNVLKDEIISISNGSIQSFETVSVVRISNGDFNVLLRVNVSLTKLSSFINKKTNSSVSFDGSMYDFNFKLKNFYTQNEEKIVSNILLTCQSLIKNCFIYQLSVKDPRLISTSSNQFRIDFTVTGSVTKNLDVMYDYLLKNLKSVSLTNYESLSYAQSNFPRFGILYVIDNSTEASNIYIKSNFIKSDYPSKNIQYYPLVFRSKKSFELLVEFGQVFLNQLLSFKIAGLNSSNESLGFRNYQTSNISYGHLCLPYSVIPNNTINGLKFNLIQPSWHKEKSGLEVSGFSNREDKLDQFYNKILYDNNEFYKSVSGKKLIKSWWPGVGVIYSEEMLDLEYRMPDNIERILLTRYSKDFPLLKFELHSPFTQIEISNIKNFTIFY